MAKRILLTIGYGVIVWETMFYIRGGLLGLFATMKLGESTYHLAEMILVALAGALTFFLPLALFIINQRRRRLLIAMAVVFLVLLGWGVANAVAIIVSTPDHGRFLVQSFVLTATFAAQALALVYFIKSKYLKNRVAAYEEKRRQTAVSGPMLKPPL